MSGSDCGVVWIWDCNGIEVQTLHHSHCEQYSIDIPKYSFFQQPTTLSKWRRSVCLWFIQVFFIFYFIYFLYRHSLWASNKGLPVHLVIRMAELFLLRYGVTMRSVQLAPHNEVLII